MEVHGIKNIAVIQVQGVWLCRNCDNLRIQKLDEWWDRVLHPEEWMREIEHARKAHLLT